MVIDSESQKADAVLVEATRVEACYQCGKCTAGCPVGEEMERGPHQLVRLVQLGQVDRAAADPSAWRCVSCLTCSTRCPQRVDCAAVLDALRQLAVERDLVPASQRGIVRFQQVFLDNIRRNGRLIELELIGAFKTRSFVHDWSLSELLKDSLLAPKLMKRNKFHFRGERVKDRGVVERIFQRCLKDGTACTKDSACPSVTET